MQEKCWARHQTQRNERNYLARNETSQDSGVKGAHRFAENRLKAPRRSHIGSVEAWEVSSLGRHNARHICSISSTNNGLESWISRRIVNHADDPKVCQHRSDSFTPVAIDTSGVLSVQTRELLTELGKRIFEITEEVEETTYLFQQVSVAIQRGNMFCFTGSFVTNDV